jgi:formiminotetrahydrofolate cyclodeaminase
MRSDLQVARLLAEAAARGALANVAINLDGLQDAAYVLATRAKTAALEGRLGNAPRTRSA